jgi:hypothetical protein
MKPLSNVLLIIILIGGCAKEPTMYEKCMAVETIQAENMTIGQFTLFAQNNGYPYYTPAIASALQSYIENYEKNEVDYMEKQVELYQTLPEIAAYLTEADKLKNTEPYASHAKVREAFSANKINHDEFKNNEHYDCMDACAEIGNKITSLMNKVNIGFKEVEDKLPNRGYLELWNSLTDPIQAFLLEHPFYVWKEIGSEELKERLGILTMHRVESDTPGTELSEFYSYRYAIMLTEELPMKNQAEPFPWQELRSEMKTALDTGLFRSYLQNKLSVLVTAPNPQKIGKVICNTRGLYE